MKTGTCSILDAKHSFIYIFLNRKIRNYELNKGKQGLFFIEQTTL
jgi:hypothetical protein